QSTTCRAPSVASTAANYNRVEAPSANNACTGDDQCVVSGSCGEVCAAVSVSTFTCETQPLGLGSCGCVAGRRVGSKALTPCGPDFGGRGQHCATDGTCAFGLTCVHYFGIAGPSGPTFASCETPCNDGQACPAGLNCVTIADGPGSVCR